MIKTLGCAILMALGMSLMAAEPAARIDIDGKDAGITLTLGDKPAGGNVVMLDDNAILCAESAPLATTDWQTFSFSFTPSKDGIVALVLEGGRTLGDNNSFWICFDHVEATGAAIVDGDFETRDVTGRPVGWSIPDLYQYISFKGDFCVRVRYDKPIQQKITVKAGQTVTIKAKIRKIKA